MKTKHKKYTKREWHIEGYYSIEGFGSSHAMVYEEIEIKKVFHKNIVAIAFGTNTEKGCDNLKLMAAAPLLLSEHQMDLQHLKTWKSKLIDAGLKGSVLYEEYEDMIESKKKAIKKATP